VSTLKKYWEVRQYIRTRASLFLNFTAVQVCVSVLICPKACEICLYLSLYKYILPRYIRVLY